MGIWGELGKAVIGANDKAILYVKKPSTRTKDTIAGGMFDIVDKITVPRIQDMVLRNMGNPTPESVFKDGGYFKLEVQFNPSSLRFESAAGKQVSINGGNMGAQAANQVVQYTQPISTTMSFQLIFDDVNVYDAFMMQNMNLSVGNVVSGVADAVKSAKALVSGKPAYSVRSQIDGIMGLLVKPETRMVMFSWGKINFVGELTRVDARYTMFNKQGEPVRGVVNLEIRQGETMALGFDKKYQSKAFDKVFVEGTGSSLLKKVANNNLLNLNI